MLELLEEILQDNITPNQLLLLYGLDESIHYPQINPHLELRGLKSEGYVVMNEDVDVGVELTAKGRQLKIKYDNYFLKSKKNTNSILMGKDYVKKVEEYREIFPAKKLPSGKPARTNVKTLTKNFVWFFKEYDVTWDEVIAATKRYVNEYELKDFMYMQTSQYFICKSDQSKVKQSQLMDYVDMIRDGIEDENNNHFSEKVV
tara:strand:- start:686 stop:1291 length:606 start_codon:yes stop_codon:yes gene_type:complete